MPFSISTLVGEFILVERVYLNIVISVNQKDTIGWLVELDVVAFDVILGVD